MLHQKSGPARAETRRGGLCGEPLRIDDEAGLSAREATAQRSVLPKHQRPPPRASVEDARDCPYEGALRLSTCPRAVAPGRLAVGPVYCEEQLQLRSKLPKRRKMVVTRVAKIVPIKPNDAWSMDFVADQLADGSKFRTLTIVDVFTKEALAIEVGQRLKGEHVVSALNRIAARRGAPRHLFVDNGSEFSGRLLDMWAHHYRAKIDFSRPGKPTDNCHIETFNGSFRDECLNLHWFETLGEAKAIVEAWRRDYNESRPHSALKELAPAEFARQLVPSSGSTEPETPQNSL